MNWHQQQNPVVLYHPTQWSVVTMGACTSVMRFPDNEGAARYLDNITKRGDKAYLLPPTIEA